jgi:hypothetical protein
MKFNFKDIQNPQPGKPDKVTFQEKGHKYTGSDGRTYTSVTTLLSAYYPPFEGEKWSLYKAIKDEYTSISEPTWKAFRQKAGGWIPALKGDNIIKYYKDNRHTIPSQIRNNIAVRKDAYLKEWKAEGELACKLGTGHHNSLEQLVLSSKRIDIGRGQIATTSPGDLLKLQGLLGDDRPQVFTELLLWSEKYRLAGQADLVEKPSRGKIHIKDYKSFKEVQLEAFMDETFYEPLQELPNTNYSKATMQLSTYGYMLELLGYEIVGCTMIHIDRISGAHIKDYPLAYRRDLVIKMLEDYDKRRKA